MNEVMPEVVIGKLMFMNRLEKARHIPNGDVLRVLPGYFNVRSQSGKGAYVVVNSAPDCSGTWCCSCNDYMYRGVECKHILKMREFGGECE